MRRRVVVGASLAIAMAVAGVVLSGQASAVATAGPEITVLDASTPEGASGTVHTVSVPVTLSAASAGAVTADWRTADGTARGDEPDRDYYASNGTVTFAPGTTSASIDVLIDGGDGPEGDETFTITLTNPVNGTLARSVSTVTILNDDVPPPPDPGEVNVIPTGGGQQCVALKDAAGCRPLDFGEQISIEEILYINPRRGKVTVQSIVGVGQFYGGQFSLTEIGGTSARSTAGAAAKPILVVKLRGGNFKACKGTNRSLAATGAVEAKKKPIRRLWGKGKGRFRTRGQYSSGTVRGTNWVTEDYCNGTRTRVVTGIVQVYDLVKKTWVLLKPGQSYFAQAPKTR